MDMYNVIFLNGTRLGNSEVPIIPSDRIIIANGCLFQHEIYHFILKMGVADFGRAVDDCIAFAIKKLHGEMDRRLDVYRRNLHLGIKYGYGNG
jgi:hypothetical protein